MMDYDGLKQQRWTNYWGNWNSRKMGTGTFTNRYLSAGDVHTSVHRAATSVPS